MALRVKKVIFVFLLTAAYLFLAGAVVSMLDAEIQFNTARMLVLEGKPQEAQIKYLRALRLNPFNSGYYFQYADFLYGLCRRNAGRNNCLEKAGYFIREAVNLNPFQPDYYLWLGLAHLDLYRDSGARGPKVWLEDFKRALECDPRGFLVSYKIGYAGLSVWGSLGAQEKDFFLKRLVYCLKLKPWYGEYIYPRLWEVSRDSRLLQEVRPQEELPAQKEKVRKIDEFKKNYFDRPQATNAVSAQEWQGIAEDGRNIFKAGQMFWAGTVYSFINVPPGSAVIKIKAKGQKASGSWPHMVVCLDACEIGETFVNSESEKEYSFKFSGAGGIKVLSISFANDFYQNGEDRNLFILGATAVKDEG